MVRPQRLLGALLLLLAAVMVTAAVPPTARRHVIRPRHSQHMAGAEDSHGGEGHSYKDTGVSMQGDSFKYSGVPRAPEFVNRFNRLVAKPAGNMVRLKCPANGNPSPNITWLFDGEKRERKFGEFKYGRWSLLLEDLVTADSGKYTCIVCNDLGCINFTFRVEVVERFPHRPYIEEGYPVNRTVTVNSTATFECKVKSDDEPFIQWAKTGYFPIDITSGDTVANTTLIKKFYYNESNPDILKIHNVTEEDEGWYICIAANSLGVTYAAAYLHVVNDCDTVGDISTGISLGCPVASPALTWVPMSMILFLVVFGYIISNV